MCFVDTVSRNKNEKALEGKKACTTKCIIFRMSFIFTCILKTFKITENQNLFFELDDFLHSDLIKNGLHSI